MAWFLVIQTQSMGIITACLIINFENGNKKNMILCKLAITSQTIEIGG